MNWTKTLLAAAALAIGLWMLVFSPRMELLKTQLDHAHQQLAAAGLLDRERVAVIESQSEQLAGVLVAELKNRELLAQIASQSRAHTQALQELKRHDAQIIDYLQQPVPAGLGRLYQRNETTDPAAYRQPSDVPTDSVRAASAADAGDE